MAVADAAALEQAVLEFYRQPTPEIDELLRRFQQQNEAWDLSCELLRSQHQSVRAFAASTLKQCSKRDSRRLSPLEREARLNQLILLLPQCGSPQVRSQLGVGAAALCVQAGHPVAMVHAPAFQSLPLVFQLELLAYLAQESTNHNNTVAKLAAFKEELQPLVPHISAAIRAGLSSAENAPSALQCLEAWGALGLTLDQLDAEGLLEPLVIELANTDGDAFGTLAHALSLVCGASGGMAPSVFDKLVAGVNRLRGALYAAIDDEDDDRCTEIADLMVAVGKAGAGHVCAARPGSLELADMAANCTMRSHLGCAELCLELWQALLTVPRSTVHVSMGPALWAGIAEAVLVRAAYPADVANMDDDEEDARTRYRAAAGDLLGEIGAWLGYGFLLALLATRFGGQTWQNVEVTIWAATSLAHELLPDLPSGRRLDGVEMASMGEGVNDRLRAMFDEALPASSPELLLRTILAACAVYACWLPAGHPVFYTAAIRLSLGGLLSPAIYQVAGQAVAALCTVGAEQLADTGLHSELVAGIRQALLLGYACDDVIAAAMRLALRVRDAGPREAQTAEVLRLAIEAAAAGSETVSTAGLRAAKSALRVCEGDALAETLACSACSALMGILPTVIQRYHSNEDLLQAAGEAVAIAVESAGVAYRGQLPAFLAQLSALVAAAPCAPLVRVAQASFLVHGEDATLHPAFTAAVSVMCGPVCAQIASGSFADSELIAAFYTLLGNILTRPSSVSILEHSDGVLVSVQTAVECLLKAWHADAFRRVCSFVASLALVVEEKYPRLRQYAETYANMMTVSLVVALGESARPPGTANQVAPALYALIQGVGAKSVSACIVEADPGPSGHALAERIRGGKSLMQVARACEDYHAAVKDLTN